MSNPSPFLDWLKQYAYVAAWLAPLVALIGMMVRGVGKEGEVAWAKMMLYIGFLSSLAATFTPALENGARVFAGSISMGLAIFFMCEVELDAGVKRAIQRKQEGLAESAANEPKPGRIAQRAS